MESCKFSAVVPVYNVEDYLERCVRSLQKQEGTPYEILLIDDGSTDGSGELCDRLAQSDERIRVYHKRNGGLSSARNYGIDRANGQYVLFVDSDDSVSPSLLRDLERAFREHPNAEAAVYGGVEVNPRGERRPLRSRRPGGSSLYSGRDYLLRCWRERDLNVEAWLYAWRRDFLNREKLRFREGILHEDVEFTPRALLRTRSLLELPGNYYLYAVRKGSISTGKDMTRNIRDLFRTLEAQCRLAQREDPELRRWMKNAALDSYLNMIQEARMDQKRYRRMVKKRFLLGKAATLRNHLRAGLCLVSVRLYCRVNEWSKSRLQKARV